ncbi:Uma2 family endonuclease [Sphingomonas sp. PAMC 26605]|uniref:Uma2 family endonuclease n=1 Tax=Sphingomonas sp. PAMC 26605 TaxID=1112214 RepID=UPI00026CCB5E|nr:Uma2 family endonuclease [Sphingomonas sp. PAMC 26605]
MNASAPVLTTPHKVGLRVEDFLLLNASGAFDDYGKTELIDGDIYVMNAQFSEHAGAKSRLAFALTVRLREIGSDLELMTEVAIRLNDDSMPEPDIVLHRWRGEGPVPVESVALVIEVSDTTLANDLGRKSDLYAAAGIPEYWVIDLNESRALMHENPDSDGYHGQLDILLTDRLVSATIADLEVDGSEVTR